MSRARGGKTVGGAITITGVKEIDRRLKQLEPRIQKKLLTRSMRAAMKVVQAQAKANARSAFTSRSGETVKGIKVRATRRSRSRFGIDVRINKGAYVGKTFYAAFLEWGTSRMPARPFMAPAYATAGPGARDIALKALRAGILAEAKAMGKR